MHLCGQGRVKGHDASLQRSFSGSLEKRSSNTNRKHETASAQLCALAMQHGARGMC